MSDTNENDLCRNCKGGNSSLGARELTPEIIEHRKELFTYREPKGTCYGCGKAISERNKDVAVWCSRACRLAYFGVGSLEELRNLKQSMLRSDMGEPGNVEMREKAEVSIMEPDIMTGSYHERKVLKNLWKCSECGLVWQMKHEAQSCRSRGHESYYFKGYGGRVENGEYKPNLVVTFRAIRREKGHE